MGVWIDRQFKYKCVHVDNDLCAIQAISAFALLQQLATLQFCSVARSVSNGFSCCFCLNYTKQKCEEELYRWTKVSFHE